MEIAGRVIVTGSSGFVGGALGTCLGRPFEALHLGTPDWRRDLAGMDLRSAVVFHLAARAHRRGHDDDVACERDNVDKTRVLAERAAAHGARRLVFLSSVKVNGEETRERPFGPQDEPHPEDAYGRSKWSAERELARIASSSGLEVVTVRSPLVFGPGAGGNLRALMRLADSPWPLPFGAIDNRRSFVDVADLARLLVLCGAHPQAAGKTFFAAHARSFSTPQVVSLMRAAFGRPARLVRVPVRALEAMAALAGQSQAMRRLTRSLEVDAGATERTLDWSAQVGIEAAVQGMVAACREERA